MTLKISHVQKSYSIGGEKKTVLQDVSLQLAAGETLALTGESGSGKSTLLHLAAALDDCESGDISVCGQNLTGLSERSRAKLRRDVIAVVFQQFNLVPSLSVWDNVALQARMGNRFDRNWCAELCASLGLADLRHHFPDQLSGGQQQRVAIARAMALRPALMLADEPTGNLDEATSATVMDNLLELVEQENTALMLVTHSEAIANRLSRRLHLSNGMLA